MLLKVANEAKQKARSEASRQILKFEMLLTRSFASRFLASLRSAIWSQIYVDNKMVISPQGLTRNNILERTSLFFHSKLESRKFSLRHSFCSKKDKSNKKRFHFILSRVFPDKKIF